MFQYARESILVFTTQIICVSLGLVASVVVARVLGPEGKGVLALMALIPGFLSLIGNLGIGSANVYFIGGKKYGTRDLVSNSTLLASGIGALLILLFLPLRGWIGRSFLRGVPSSYLVIAICSIPFLIFITYFSNILRGQLRFRAFNGVNLVKVGGRLFFIIVLVLILKCGILGGVIATVASMIVAGFLSLGLVFPREGLRPGLNSRLLKDSLIYGLKGHLGNMVQFFNYRLDVFLVSYFLGVKEVGLYALGVTLAELIWHIPEATAVVLFPKVSSSEKEEASRLTSRVVRNVLLLTLLSSAGWAILGRWLIPLIFGSRFTPSILPFWILLLGVVALGLPKVITGHLAGTGKPQYGTYLSSISLALTIALDLVLIPRLGITGAALATTIAYTASGVLSIYWFTKESKRGLAETLIVRIEDLRSYGNLLQSLRFARGNHDEGPQQSTKADWEDV